MKPKIIMEDQICLIGMSFYGDPFNNASAWSEENEIGYLWNRFINYYNENTNLIKHIKETDVFCEIHYQTPETAEKGYVEVFVGVPVENIREIPLQCVAKQLPGTIYAVFTLEGQEIISDWGKKIYQEWLPHSDYELSYNFNIQFYDYRFKGMDNIQESVIDVYIPIKNKNIDGGK